MNLIVVPFRRDGFYCRPDSTLIRSIETIYIPDHVEKIAISPVMYIKTLRAGKAISNRFVGRYIDSYGFGAIIHPTLKDGIFTQEVTHYIENSLDFTSLIPLLSFPESEFATSSQHRFEITHNYQNPFSPFILPSLQEINGKISEISQYCSLRIGDFILFELYEMIPIEIGSRLIGKVDETTIFNLKIK